MPTEIVFIYTTFPDKGLAEKAARQLIEKKLIGCANIIPEMQSIFSWNGKIESAREVIMILKTRSELFEPCRTAIKALHPYDTPCILQMKISKGDEAYLDWLNQTLLPA